MKICFDWIFPTSEHIDRLIRQTGFIILGVLDTELQIHRIIFLFFYRHLQDPTEPSQVFIFFDFLFLFIFGFQE